MRVVRHLEGLHPVRLQAVRPPHAGDPRVAHPKLLRQRAGAPLRGVFRLGLRGRFKNLLGQLGPVGARVARPRGVLLDPRQAFFREPLPPRPDRAPGHADFHRDLGVRLPLGRQQHDLGPLHQPHGRRVAPAVLGELHPLLLRQLDRYRYPDAALRGLERKAFYHQKALSAIRSRNSGRWVATRTGVSP